MVADVGRGDEAAKEIESSSIRNITQGGEKMVYGFGRGLNRGGGAGLGFRGNSPPWPYVGRGRGGLPRCWHFFGAPPYHSYPGAWGEPYYWGPPPRGAAYAPRMTREQELDFLKEQAKAVREQLEDIEARMREPEATGA